jgi:hypothetical protein
MSAGFEQRQRDASELCQRRNGARSDHVVTGWCLRCELLRSRVHDAESRGEPARRNDHLKKAGLLPGRLNEIKRRRWARRKEARREWSSRKPSTAPEIGKRAATRQKLIDQRNGDKRVEEVPRGALTRTLNTRQVDEWIPGIEKS